MEILAGHFYIHSFIGGRVLVVSVDESVQFKEEYCGKILDSVGLVHVWPLEQFREEFTYYSP